MVVGLDRFAEHFRDHGDRYVLIGGVATQLALESAGVAFRATKDLDIVLLAEALDSSFVEHFWDFVRQGRYGEQQYSSDEANNNKRRTLYRFSKPLVQGYPAMLELFSRHPSVAPVPGTGQLVRIAADDAVSSLSAILLDDDYYALILANRIVRSALPVLREEALIVLKARAWLDLTDRKARGEPVDSKTIRKHAMDVLRLAQLLTPAMRFALSEPLRRDVGEYLTRVAPALNPVEVFDGVGPVRTGDALAALALVYQIGPSQE